MSVEYLRFVHVERKWPYAFGSHKEQKCVVDCRDRVKKLLICWLFVRRKCMRFICLIWIDSFHMHHAISFLFFVVDQYSKCKCCLPSNICVCQFYLHFARQFHEKSRSLHSILCLPRILIFIVSHSIVCTWFSSPKKRQTKPKTMKEKWTTINAEIKLYFLTPNEMICVLSFSLIHKHWLWTSETESHNSNETRKTEKTILILSLYVGFFLF